jgi:hypothetical protein
MITAIPLLLYGPFVACYRVTFTITFTVLINLGAGILSLYSDSLRDRKSGDRIPVGGENFLTFPNRPWGPPSLLYNGYQVFPWGKAAGAWC